MIISDECFVNWGEFPIGKVKIKKFENIGKDDEVKVVIFPVKRWSFPEVSFRKYLIHRSCYIEAI